MGISHVSYPKPHARTELILIIFCGSRRNVPVVNNLQMNLDELRIFLHNSQSLERLLREALAKISANVEIINDKFTDAVNKTKFSTIPDDILAIILEMVCEDGSHAAGGLALVCRRFHQLVVSMPVLWSTIFYGAVDTLKKAKYRASRVNAPVIDAGLGTCPGRAQQTRRCLEILFSAHRHLEPAKTDRSGPEMNKCSHARRPTLTNNITASA